MGRRPVAKVLLPLKIVFGVRVTVLIASLSTDLQRLLIDIGAIKANDHRVLRSDNTEGENVYSSIRSGHTNDTEGDDDDWE